MKDRNRRRKKLSKLKKAAIALKLRLPTCKGGFAFNSKKDYKRSKNKEIVKKEMDE